MMHFPGERIARSEREDAEDYEQEHERGHLSELSIVSREGGNLLVALRDDTTLTDAARIARMEEFNMKHSSEATEGPTDVFEEHLSPTLNARITIYKETGRVVFEALP